MPAASSSSSSVPLIKGYIPVRLRLPRQPQLVRLGNDNDDDDNDDDNTEDTFFFVREHQGKSSEDSNDTSATTTTKRGTTLFVANAPIVPGVSTKLLLKSIFGRFAEVTRVTAVQNPRAAAAVAAAASEGAVSGIATNTLSSIASATSSSIFAWTDKEAIFQPTFLPPILSSNEGKYAHVVFSTAKEMKQAKKALEDVMSSSASTGNNSSRRRSEGRSSKQGNEQTQERALLLDKLELQTLSDESQRQREELFRRTMKEDYEDDDDDDFGDSDNEDISGGKSRSQTVTKKISGVLAVAQRYRESCKLLKSPAKLMEECNAVMQAYEGAEEAKRRAQEAAKAEPDDDGFVSVSYSNAVGSKIEFEQSATATTPSRRKGNKRSRKKKEAVGSGELKDFYRFQRADNRKRTMQDLRRQFEEDVRKVKRLKQEKEYRPF